MYHYVTIVPYTQEAGIVYLEVEGRVEVGRSVINEEMRQKREKCCQLPKGLTMYDLYTMEERAFKRLEEMVPGAETMRPYCVAEMIAARFCEQFVKDADRKGDDDSDLDEYIGSVAIFRNKTLRGMEEDKYCHVLHVMPIEQVRHERQYVCVYFNHGIDTMSRCPL